MLVSINMVALRWPPVPCLGPRSTRGGGADLGRGRKGVGKISIGIKTCNSWVYATDVFVTLEYLELKTNYLTLIKLLFRFFQFQLLVYEKLQFTPC